jgi:nitroreductase
MNTFIDMILTRHSVREFTGEIIQKEDLETIVKAGMSAPSAVNIQPWAFIIITEEKILNSLCQNLPYAKMLDKAGGAIIVCGIPEKDDQIAQKFWMMDCSAATENILLAAHSLSYGAVWTAVYPDEDRIKTVREECNIPNNIIPLNVIPIGIPVNRNAQPIDKYKSENIHWNKW